MHARLVVITAPMPFPVLWPAKQKMATHSEINFSIIPKWRRKMPVSPPSLLIWGMYFSHPEYARLSALCCCLQAVTGVRMGPSRVYQCGFGATWDGQRRFSRCVQMTTLFLASEADNSVGRYIGMFTS